MRQGLVKKQILDKRGKRTSVWVRSDVKPKKQPSRVTKSSWDFMPKEVKKPDHRGMGSELYNMIKNFGFDNGFMPYKDIFSGTRMFKLIRKEEKVGWGGDDKYVFKVVGVPTDRMVNHEYVQKTDYEDKPLKPSEYYKQTANYDKNVIDGSKIDSKKEEDNWRHHLINGWKPLHTSVNDTADKNNPFDDRKFEDPDHIYRGMSSEEMRSIVKSGVVQTNAKGNFGFQGTTTFFSSQPSVASSYAGGFAMWHSEGTTAEPSYIIKVKKNDKMTYDENGETGYEVGVNSGVTKDDIVEIWEIRPSIDRDNREIEFYIERPSSRSVAERKREVKEGSRNTGGERWVYKSLYKK